MAKNTKPAINPMPRKTVAQQAMFQQTLHKGIIETIQEEGVIALKDCEDHNLTINCLFLRTTASPPPEFQIGDQVVYLITNAEGTEGCVLGIEEPYKSKKDRLKESLTKQGKIKSVSTVEDQVIHIKATEGFAIECGKATIIMTKDGKVQIKGTDLLSRARRINKIKGAGVNIN